MCIKQLKEVQRKSYNKQHARNHFSFIDRQLSKVTGFASKLYTFQLSEKKNKSSEKESEKEFKKNTFEWMVNTHIEGRDQSISVLNNRF